MYQWEYCYLENRNYNFRILFFPQESGNTEKLYFRDLEINNREKEDGKKAIQIAKKYMPQWNIPDEKYISVESVFVGLGKSGWELVNVVTPEFADWGRIYFKRLLSG